MNQDKISCSVVLFFLNGAEDWKLFDRLTLHLAAHSACRLATSVDSEFGENVLTRRKDFLFPQQGDGKETDV